MTALHLERKIDRYLLGETRGERSLRAHLAQCERCRAWYDAGVLALRAARQGSAGLGELERLTRLSAAVTASRRPGARRTRQRSVEGAVASQAGP